MRAIIRAVGPVALIAGVVLLADALSTGAARFYLLLVLPVITGTSPLFVLAVVLVLIGVFFLPLAFAGNDEPEARPPAPAPSKPGLALEEAGAGAVVFVGPVPIFFGAWRKNPPIAYRWALVLGVVLVVVALLVLWGFAAF